MRYVRELENTISTACITATGDFIDISDLPDHLQQRLLLSTRSANSIFKRFLKCATAIVAELHKSSALAAPACIVT